MGRRPELKSDEKREVPLLDTEISSCEGSFTAEKVLHLFGALPHGMYCLLSSYVKPTFRFMPKLYSQFVWDVKSSNTRRSSQALHRMVTV